MATTPATRTTFKPFVPATETRPELSVRALLLGALFGILFGAVTVYVGLRAGLTVAASIPISVLSISILRAFGKASILENNIVQTTGNAGQSIASGVIFTLPALIFLGFDLESTRIFALALFGGWLGVLFMIPLRKQLIVDEHETLTYPEGTACADVLEAGERGGSFASRVFLGLGLGGLYTLFQNENLFALFPSTPNYQPDLGPQHLLRGSAIRADVTPEYLGVGYIIGVARCGCDAGGWGVLLARADAGDLLLRLASSRPTVPGHGAHPRDGPIAALVDVCAPDGCRSRGGGGPDYAVPNTSDDRRRSRRWPAKHPQEQTVDPRCPVEFRQCCRDAHRRRAGPDRARSAARRGARRLRRPDCAALGLSRVPPGAGSAGRCLCQPRSLVSGRPVRLSVCHGVGAHRRDRGLVRLAGLAA